MLRRKYWYKKGYKKSWIEMIFLSALSITLVLEINLISHTLDVANSHLMFVGGIVFLLLTLGIQLRANMLSDEIDKGKRKIVSNNSKKYLFITKRFTIVSLLPFAVSMLSKQDNMQLLGILVSAIILVIFKSYMDLIVTFSEEGYSSGFDDIRIEPCIRVEEMQKTTHSIIGDIITFELYKDKKYKGYDKFTQEDFVFLKRKMEHIIYDNTNRKA